MTTGDPTRPRSRETSSRSTTLLIAAAVLVVAVVAAVLVFGVARPPDLESLADAPDPEPSAAVAWAEWRRDESCLSIARPDGTVTELRCDPRGGDLVGWREDGPLLLARYDVSQQLIEIDPGTGEVLATRSGEPPFGPEEPFDGRGGQAVVSYHDDGELVVEFERTELWRVDAPEAYEVRNGWVSPDGRFVAVTDSADRLLVMPTDGSASPRVWSDDVPGWANLVWEGSSGP